MWFVIYAAGRARALQIAPTRSADRWESSNKKGYIIERTSAELARVALLPLSSWKKNRFGRQRGRKTLRGLYIQRKWHLSSKKLYGRGLKVFLKGFIRTTKRKIDVRRIVQRIVRISVDLTTFERRNGRIAVCRLPYCAVLLKPGWRER